MKLGCKLCLKNFINLKGNKINDILMAAVTTSIVMDFIYNIDSSPSDTNSCNID
jgi:hypothetical protein